MIEPSGLTDELIEALQNYGVKPYEISHLKKGSTNKIGRDRMKKITALLNATLVNADQFVPFDETKKKEFAGIKKIFVLPVNFEKM
ncbi:MAG: hypothetical protein UR18_C0006G0033 [Candidatus Nomurabacteria bacterium GW2011_GWE2_31_40]|nr:MAG: hypothetical protein UR18_C0006G0033 [Candidatus Nomurabacteria bacterium GW2011_GWE2_31_40]